MSLANFPGIKLGEILSKYSSYRVGGPAKYFYDLMDLNHLPEIFSLAKKEKIAVKVIGRGCNILFLDHGFNGLIIRMLAGKISLNNNILEAEAGAWMQNVLKTASEAKFACLDCLSFLPGTLGGAIYGNAGTGNCEIGDFVKEIQVFSEDKGFFPLKKQDAEFAYRSSIFKKGLDVIICKIILQLERKNLSGVDIKEIKAKRASQPKGLSCGSFFINPKGEKAGKLIELAGLKGYKIGDAKVSEEHANWIINLGKASAKDILGVRDHIKQTVKEKFQIDLEEEVRIIG